MNEPCLVPKHIRSNFDLTGKIWLIRTEVETLIEPPHVFSLSTEQHSELMFIIARLKQIESDLVAEMNQKMKS